MTPNDPPANETAGTDAEVPPVDEPTVTVSGENETRVDAPDREATARIFTPEDLRGEVEISTSVSVTAGTVDVGLGFRVDNSLVNIYLEDEDALALAEDLQKSIKLARETADDA